MSIREAEPVEGSAQHIIHSAVMKFPHASHTICLPAGGVPFGPFPSARSASS